MEYDIPSGHTERSAPFTSPTVSAGSQSTVTERPSRLANIKRNVTFLGSYLYGTRFFEDVDTFIFLDSSFLGVSSFFSGESGARSSVACSDSCSSVLSSFTDSVVGVAGAEDVSAVGFLSDSPDKHGETGSSTVVLSSFGDTLAGSAAVAFIVVVSVSLIFVFTLPAETLVCFGPGDELIVRPKRVQEKCSVFPLNLFSKILFHFALTIYQQIPIQRR